MNSVSAVAHTNIALIKYWGKADHQHNLPATGSLSLTLDAFYTQTTLQESEQDSLILNGHEETGKRLARVQVFLDFLRHQTGKQIYTKIISENHVPTEGGLASSASGFAALALAASKLFGLNLSPKALSELARVGSGSAARSIFPGLVRMHKAGYAEPVSCSALDLNLLVVQCSKGEKHLDSRTAMNLTAQTSPYYPAWLSTHDADLKTALKAIETGDFQALGEVTERSALKMHASMMAASPGFWYFEPLSLTVMSQVRKLREAGLFGYFTLDAGPHVKVLCESSQVDLLRHEIEKIPGILGVKLARPGPGAYLL